MPAASRPNAGHPVRTGADFVPEGAGSAGEPASTLMATSGPPPRVRIAFDMETRDPDDALTLCLLAAHPRVELLAVSLTPGTPTQVGVVREVLRRIGVQVPVGARNPANHAGAVSPFHLDWLGPVPPAAPDALAHELLDQTLRTHPDCTLLTGAPLHNLRLLLRHHPETLIARWVAQGGFAGDNLVAARHRLPKFAGRTACESFNFGGDSKATLLALASPRIGERRFVGKNVTHGVAWDRALHDSLVPMGIESPGLTLALEAMALYLRDRPQGKLLHDPLAASAALDPGAFTWVEADILYNNGQWGSTPRQGTGTFVAVAVDRARALAALLAPGNPAPSEWHP